MTKKCLLIDLNLIKDVAFTETEIPKLRSKIDGSIQVSLGGFYAYLPLGADTSKIKAIMINKAIGEAVLQIKAAEERIEKLRGLRP